MSLRPFVLAILLIPLIGCTPQSPPAPVKHGYASAEVLSVSQVVEHRETKREEYACRSGSSWPVCVKTRQIYRPSGFEARLKLAGGQVVEFFDVDPASVLGETEGQTVCAHTMEGPFGFVIAGVSSAADNPDCKDPIEPGSRLSPETE